MILSQPNDTQLANFVKLYSIGQLAPSQPISGSVPQSIWILDSGATDHMTSFPSHFTSYLKVPKRQPITVANEDHVPIVGYGNLQLHSSLSLHNVLQVPKLDNNLISIHRLKQDWNCAMTFFRSHCVIQELTTGRTIGVAKEQGGLYYLQHTKIGNNINKEELPSSQRATSETWAASQIWLYHKRLGHPPFGLLKTIFSHLFTKEFVESFKYDIFQFPKHHRATFSPSNNKSLEPFDLIHSDVWGAASNSISRAKWFVSFIDDCTHVTWIFLMKHKYEVCQIFFDFFRLAKNQLNKSIKRLWSYNDTEFVNLEFSKFLKDNGMVHQLTCVNTPQQNGVAERKNRHLLEVARVLLFQMSVSNVYWGEVVLTATYLINRLPTRVLNGISPIKHILSFFPSSPLMLSLPNRVFVCVAFVHSHNPHHGKLDPKAVKCVFIGYPSNKKGFKCYHPLSLRFFVSMAGELSRSRACHRVITFSYSGCSSSSSISHTYSRCSSSRSHETHSGPRASPNVRAGCNIPDNSIEGVTDDMTIALRKEKRSCVKYLISQFVCTDHLSEALKDENWVQVMKEEMEVLEKNLTWEIVDRPKDKRPVGCRWIYTMKCKSDGTLERYKVRLVAKGYTQTYGIDYEETFVPIAKMNTVRVIISLAAHFTWNLQQFDVKNAFLHGDLEKEVYMEIPLGFYSHNEKNKVCKLKKALYGLKQSPRAWFGRFSQVMISLGYRQSQGDHTLFIKHSPNGKLTLLLVYVDDMIVIGDDEIEKLNLKEKLIPQFEMKELGKLKYFLGIEVAYFKKYVLDLLKETRKLGWKISRVPIEQNHRIGCEESPIIEKFQYQRLVGKSIYLSHTMPDIAYVVSVVSQFMHDPRERHLQAVERILQKEGTLSMKIYTDANYAGSVVDRRSTLGYCMFLGGNLVTWRSKKQNVVARSSAEAEFQAMAQGICEGFWMKIILDDLKVKYEGSIKLFCDNNSAISIAHNLVQHDRTKHIEIDRHFIKEKLDNGLIVTAHVPIGLQVVDVFTIGLPATRFQELNGKLGMIDIHLST
ncbi:hypothetical protein CR513_53499, partial [Mucuna pruriens]